jgi:putative FmdB family regulatory protein
MPIYDYQCRNCQDRFELVVLKSTVVVCPNCQSSDLEQLVSGGFAVSSDGIRRANVGAARRAAANSSDYRDQKVAEAEYVKKHVD